MQADNSAPVVRVTVEDLATGEQQTKDLPDGEYFVLTTGGCHVAHTNSYPAKGTHIVTIKGRTAR